MKQASKRTSEHIQMPSIKKSQSSHKNDIFDEFQSNRQIFKKDKDNLSNNQIMFKTKQKSKMVAQQDDYYNQDFDDIQNSQNVKSKNASELPAITIQKKNSKFQESLKKLGTEVMRQDKEMLKHRNTKSEMESSGNNINYSGMGRYEGQVQKKFGNFAGQKMSNDGINRTNEQIRQLIKHYNEILTDLINRNLAQLTTKKRKKKTTVQQSIKILEQQIKNNNKMQQFDLIELKKLQSYKQKLEEQENYSSQSLEEQLEEHYNKIKEIKKVIYDEKLAVQNQGKKLVPGHLQLGNLAKNQHQSQIGIIKQKLLTCRKDWQKNEQKLNGLLNREKQLIGKIQQLGDKDKQADELRTNSKKTEDKSKKYQDVKKKYDAMKAHINKTQALWAAKSSLISHENESIKTKVKNMELQIKNVEQSSKLSYEKSNKYLATTKPKNEMHQKAIEKIMGQMNSYSEQNVQRQMSLSQMKLMSKKKVSVDQTNTNSKAQHEQADKNQQELKGSSQQSQRNRVWKQEAANQAKQIEQKAGIDKGQLKISKTQRKSIKVQEKRITQGDREQEKQQQKQKQQSQNNVSENKPKKFNFNRNKANSQLNVHKQTQTNQNKQQPANTSQQRQTTQTQKTSTDIPPKQPQKTTEQQVIRPKRFNINLKDRKQKQQNTSYLPSSGQQIASQQLKEKHNEAVENREISKPTFNLRKKKQSEIKERLSLDNQFMGQ